jgi:hypothetical protein
MNIKSNLKRIWTIVAVMTLGLLVYSWFADESPVLLKTILALDAVMFVLSLPCSLFASAVVFFAWYVLEMNPLSVEGANLNTIFLAVLGAMQWFWIVRIWYQTETSFQKIDLLGNQT